MWIIASIPFWILGVMCLLGSYISIKWKKTTTDDEVKRVTWGLIWAGVFFLIAAKVAG